MSPMWQTNIRRQTINLETITNRLKGTYMKTSTPRWNTLIAVLAIVASHPWISSATEETKKEAGQQSEAKIPGVTLDAKFPSEMIPLLKSERPIWGLYRDGGYWRLVPAGPMEIFDIQAKWVPSERDVHEETGVIEIRYRTRVFKESSWDHSEGAQETPQKLYVKNENGRNRIAHRGGDTTLDMLMIPKGVGAVAIQFGSNGIFWKDARGNTYRPGEANPVTPPIAAIEVACAVSDPQRESFRQEGVKMK